MALNFPLNPATNDLHSEGGRTWQYTGTYWRAVGTTDSSAATGGGPDQVFFINDQVVSTSFTIPSGKNALSAGPITISDTATVTVPDGARWVIL